MSLVCTCWAAVRGQGPTIEPEIIRPSPASSFLHLSTPKRHGSAEELLAVCPRTLIDELHKLRIATVTGFISCYFFSLVAEFKLHEVSHAFGKSNFCQWKADGVKIADKIFPPIPKHVILVTVNFRHMFYFNPNVGYPVISTHTQKKFQQI